MLVPFVYLLLIIITLGATFVLVYDLINMFKGYAPHLPSNDVFIDTLHDLNEFNVGMKVADFGSGAGKLLNKLKDLPIELVGIELNPLLVMFSKIRFYRNKNIQVVHGDFLKLNLSDYEVIVIYGIPDVMAKLHLKILSERVKPLVVISNKFRFEGVVPEKVINNTFIYRF